jgi:hypothetical protein
MYAGTPVVAVSLRGPVETILDGVTLCGLWSSLGQALEHTAGMESCARKHVRHTLGKISFKTNGKKSWRKL